MGDVGTRNYLSIYLSSCLPANFLHLLPQVLEVRSIHV